MLHQLVDDRETDACIIGAASPTQLAEVRATLRLLDLVGRDTIPPHESRQRNAEAQRHHGRVNGTGKTTHCRQTAQTVRGSKTGRGRADGNTFRAGRASSGRRR